MDSLTWALSAVLSCLFLLAGVPAAIRPKSVLISDKRFALLESWPAPLIKAVGTLEIAGAAGLILPPMLGIGTWLAGAAALGLSSLMAGALTVHAARRELAPAVLCSAVLAAALVVGASRLAHP